MSRHLLAISIILLSVAFFFLGFQVGNREKREESKPAHSVETDVKGLLTLEQAASYLSMNKEILMGIIRKQDSSREMLPSFDTYMFIPYLQVGGEKYFNKEQIDEWIQYNTTTWEDVEY